MKKSYVLRFPSSAEILNETVMASYLDSGVDVNLRVASDAGHYPLAVAARALNVSVCQRLLAAGARADCWKKGHGTPMAYALRAVTPIDAKYHSERYGWLLQLCSLLAKSGANPYVDDPESPLDIAAVMGFREVVELLAQHGDRSSAVKRDFYSYGDDGELVVGPDADLNQAMRHAHLFKCEEMMIRLLKLGAKDGSFREDGMTPFQVFVTQGLNKVVQYYLVERGENPEQRTEAGRTLAQIAKYSSTKKLLHAIKGGHLRTVNGAAATGLISSGQVRAVKDGSVTHQTFEVFAF